MQKAGCVIVLAIVLAVVMALLIAGANSLDAAVSRSEWCNAHGTGVITQSSDGTYYCAQEDSPIPVPIPSWVGTDW